jgi:hypothetical protein
MYAPPGTFERQAVLIPQPALVSEVQLTGAFPLVGMLLK